MSDVFAGRRRVPRPENDPNLSYAPGTPARAELKARLAQMAAETVDIPIIIGGKEIRTGVTEKVVMPHKHGHVLGNFHKATEEHVRQAADAAVKARKEWSSWSFDDRAAVFLRAAELLTTTWRSTVVAATMLGQSKTAFQAEIDAASELVDFWRFNVAFAQELLSEQPDSTHSVWNQMEYRPLEGFVYAVSPFNFTAIGGNLAGAPALMGNAVMWKPASTVDAERLLRDALARGRGPAARRDQLPAGRRGRRSPTCSSIIPILPAFTSPAAPACSTACGRRSARTSASIAAIRGWSAKPAARTSSSCTPSADPQEVAVAAVRGAFEFQGQKCSAASRMYVPKSRWNDIRDRMVAMMKDIKVGDVRDFRNFMGAVIDKKAFDKISGYIDDGEEEREGHPGRRLQGRRGLLHRADAGRIDRPVVSPDVRRDLRAGAVGLRLRRCEVDARRWRSSTARRRTR